MDQKVIDTFTGHSGSTVELVQLTNSGVFDKYIRKKNNVARNYERMNFLSAEGVRVPKIYAYGPESEILTMEYISHLAAKDYLKNETLVADLVDFLRNFIARSAGMTKEVYDYESVIESNFAWIDRDPEIPFSLTELFVYLPYRFYSGDMYHGDMTLENIIWSKASAQFMFIDPVTVPYHSYVFDIAKLRQDTHCRWFLRNEDEQTNRFYMPILAEIDEALCKSWPQAYDNALLIVMLLRVYLHCEKGTLEYEFILTEIYKLWLGLQYG